jgi:hypothetical protein
MISLFGFGRVMGRVMDWGWPVLWTDLMTERQWLAAFRFGISFSGVAFLKASMGIKGRLYFMTSVMVKVLALILKMDSGVFFSKRFSVIVQGGSGQD